MSVSYTPPFPTLPYVLLNMHRVLIIYISPHQPQATPRPHINPERHLNALSGNCIIYHQKFIIYIDGPESDSVQIFYLIFEY